MQLFISHHSSTRAAADRVTAHLESRGVQCWVAPRDVLPGEDWDAEIARGLTSSSALLLLFSKEADESRHVKRELMIADDARLPIFTLRLQDIKPDKLKYLLVAQQWIDWIDRRDATLETLASRLRGIGFGEIGGAMPTNPHVADYPQKPDAAEDGGGDWVVVDAGGRGDFTSVAEAVAAAASGVRILVRPGVYQEGVVLDKALELVGDGDRGSIVIGVSDDHVVRSSAQGGRLANLTLRQTGGENWNCVEVCAGTLLIEDCDISSMSLAGVAVHSGATPMVRRNRIHDGQGAGVYVYDDGAGVFEDNDIFGNAFSGVQVSTGGTPTVRRNRIHDGKGAGLYVYDKGAGLFEDNVIFGNVLAGIGVATGGDPAVCRNRIFDGMQGGVLVYDQGAGVFEDNDIFGNARSGVSVTAGGSPTVCRNRIHDGRRGGVKVYGDGNGLFEDNDIFGNHHAGVEVTTGGAPTLRGNKVHDGKGMGVYVHDEGAGLIESNAIFGNAMAGIAVGTLGDPTVRRNRIYDGQQEGVRVYERGAGRFEDNEIFGNRLVGLSVESGCHPTLRNNHVT